MLRPIARDEIRTEAELADAYAVERELADRLRAAPAGERARLYPLLYEEMYRRVPKHPQLVRKGSRAETERFVSRQMGLLRPLLRPDTVFLEIGPGDCAVAFEVARHVRFVYGVDVSQTITAALDPPPNFRLALSDGVAVPVPPESVDLAYSNQLMEHLHPEDAAAQLRNIAAALKPGGLYLCITPSRLSGPHDISKYFDDVATGFHLREYTFPELRALLAQAGFDSVRPYIAARGLHLYYPGAALSACEGLVGSLPARWRRRLAPALPVRLVLGLRVVARKGPAPAA